ncbi:Predicted dithiol-disulfide isomerase, DsbA family [Halovenus aranensis]|jgi:predicted DsbA family dithiol-disulfide isomerase|uniref:Predicted dithiol-disulfide isomerase, DsbA family n=1 Tax=Halovenus aranensis TaxID=890420 RepID=A0A1G8RXE5_9EURY|nr:DsbA family protein [Halovenus aranensis]SDJ21628.1 Predicted dithiol-disulfide isomerase, DsbA family [Halovenus aranensis]
MAVTLTQFTDPFCTWCWGAEPVLRRIQETYGDHVELAFVMGGLVDDFESFADPANGITEPADVAPHWEEATQRHGMPVDASVWYENPPQSSYPACIAYEAAEFQGTAIAHRYLRRLRQAFAAEQRNIGDREVLVELADDVGLDLEQFRAALFGDRARAAFEEDRRYMHEVGARTFPTYRVTTGDDEVQLRGSQPFERLSEVLESAAPGLDRQSPRSLRSFVEEYGPVATREVAEVYQLDDEDARRKLTDLTAAGHLEERARGTGSFWAVTAND